MAPTTCASLVCAIYDVVVQPILLLLLGIAAVWFVMGVLRFISGAKIEERREKGIRHMNQGIEGLIIMFAVFGIIALVANTLGVTGNDELGGNPIEQVDTRKVIKPPGS